MVPILLGIIVVSLGAVAVVAHASLRSHSPRGQVPSLPVLLLGLWLIASALWGPYYFALRLPGFVDITIDRLVLVALLAVLGAGIVSGRVSLRELGSIELGMLLFSLVCVASMLQHGFRETMQEFPSPLHVFLNGYFLPFLIFLYAKYYVESERDLSVIFSALFYLGVYLSIMAFLEFFNVRELVFPHYINDPKIWLHLDRARGPFLNSAFNGLALNIGFTCGVYLQTRKTGFAGLAHSALLLLYLPAVFFTQTRSVYLGFVIAVVALLVLYKTPTVKWKRYAWLVALVLVALMIASPKILSPDRRAGGILQAQEIEVRMSLIKRSLIMIADKPFFGVGLAQFIPESIKRFKGKVPVIGSYTEQTQHNHLIGMGVELGLVGMGIYLAIVLSLFKRLYRLSERLDEEGFPSINLLVFLAVILSLFLVSNLFVEPAYFLFANAVFFLTGGIVDGLYREYGLGAS